jgi:hypothetical protein
MISRYADGRKPVFLRRDSVIMIRNGPRDREGEVLAKMDLAEPEGLGLEFF